MHIGSYDGDGAELILALVAPAGTDLDLFVEHLQIALRSFGYVAESIRMSELAARFGEDRPAEPAGGSAEYQRLMARMDAGNAARRRGGGNTLGLAAAAAIHAKRRRKKAADAIEPLQKRAHIVRSLKHPAEVQTLRQIYGPGFFLIGVVTTEEERRHFLAERRGCSEPEIAALFRRDEHEGGDGQRTRDTFELSDVFVRLGDTGGLKRFLRLVFGDPHETPTQDEYAMFLAFSAALRSADLSRQVGAVVVSGTGDIVGVGTNDVPAAGGGLCWSGEADDRDRHHGHDTNQIERAKLVDEVLALVAPEDVRSAGEPAMSDWMKAGREKLQTAAIMDITEYGRAVHAEMEAMLSCARSGISTRGATLFSTTFPCHNCAKHILDAGVRRVVYVEPYPKSRAQAFYPRSIAVEVDPIISATEGGPVLFQPFRGAGPRRFFDLFSIALSTGYAVKRKEKETGKTTPWDPASAKVRVPLLPNSYLTRERHAVEAVSQLTPKRLAKEKRLP